MRSVISLLAELSKFVVIRGIRACCELRRVGVTLDEFRAKGEFCELLFRDGVGVPVERTEIFFFIDKGSTLLGGTDALPVVGLGVISVFPVGKNGNRLLRGRGE
jgi:hypothetical protein